MEQHTKDLKYSFLIPYHPQAIVIVFDQRGLHGHIDKKFEPQGMPEDQLHNVMFFI